MLPDGLVVAHTGRNGSDCTVTYPRIPFDITAYEQRTRADSVDGRCFICSIVSGERDDHLVVFRDDVCIAFLAKFPTRFGYTLVAPLEHRTDVVGSFTEAEYAELQQRVHRVGRAVSASVPTERLYVLSLGSHQGNAHVHWHVAPLPPGVPYRRQQYAALMHETEGQLDIPPADLVALANASRRTCRAGRRRRSGDTGRCHTPLRALAGRRSQPPGVTTAPRRRSTTRLRTG